VIALLKHVEATDPDEPIVLWYLGLSAAQDDRTDEARGYWSRLLTKMPPGAQQTKLVQSALDALSKR
jgi:cytochrome c-type biogenesis protein CcmH/NrfG